MTKADESPIRVDVGVTRDRLARLTPKARRLHRLILEMFAATGQAPSQDLLAKAVPGADADIVLRELHDADVIRLGGEMKIRAAYPFSATPTPHLVRITSGPAVHAMCAIDAVGIAEMLGRDISVESVDAQSGEPVRVLIQNGQLTSTPADAVVFVPSPGESGGDCCARPAADSCCGAMNFFASRSSAEEWLLERPAMRGAVLDTVQAYRLGGQIFGHLMDADLEGDEV